MKLCSLRTKIVPQTVGKFAKKRCFLYVYRGFLMTKWVSLGADPVSKCPLLWLLPRDGTTRNLHKQSANRQPLANLQAALKVHLPAGRLKCQLVATGVAPPCESRRLWHSLAVAIGKVRKCKANRQQWRV